MILGGGNCQKSAFHMASSLGIETLVADCSLDAPGIALANYHSTASTFDSQACSDAARKYKVDGIMTLGTDQPVLTAAIVAEDLGLPTMLTVEQAQALTNKRLMKKRFEEKRIPTLPYELVNKSTDFDKIKRFKGPFVLKPLDSQGQRGVYRLNNLKEVEEALSKTLSFSREEEALLEEYYPSDEITISGWVKKRKLTLLTVTDRLLLEDPVNIGVCTSHRFPSIHFNRGEEIRAISEDVAHAFDLQEGPLYIQMLVGQKGILVNEAAFRIGGAFEDIIIPKITGFDILEGVMAKALGQEPGTTWPKDFNCFQSLAKASVQLMFSRPGHISSITPINELLALEAVLDAGYNYKEGQWVRKVQDATARFGHCVFYRENGELEPYVDTFQKNFYILDKQGQNLYQKLR